MTKWIILKRTPKCSSYHTTHTLPTPSIFRQHTPSLFSLLMHERHILPQFLFPSANIQTPIHSHLFHYSQNTSHPLCPFCMCSTCTHPHLQFLISVSALSPSISHFGQHPISHSFTSARKTENREEEGESEERAKKTENESHSPTRNHRRRGRRRGRNPHAILDSNQGEPPKSFPIFIRLIAAVWVKGNSRKMILK